MPCCSGARKIQTIFWTVFMAKVSEIPNLTAFASASFRITKTFVTIRSTRQGARFPMKPSWALHTRCTIINIYPEWQSVQCPVSLWQNEWHPLGQNLVQSWLQSPWSHWKHRPFILSHPLAPQNLEHVTLQNSPEKPTGHWSHCPLILLQVLWHSMGQRELQSSPWVPKAQATIFDYKLVLILRKYTKDKPNLWYN